MDNEPMHTYSEFIKPYYNPFDYSYYKDDIINRKDKSLLVIRPHYYYYSFQHKNNKDDENDPNIYRTPLIFKDRELINPDQVTKLVILNDPGYNTQEELEESHCCILDKPYHMFQEIVDFHNLEILQIHCLELPTKVWVEFAKNCKCLKKLYMEYTDPDNYFEHLTKEALEALVQIPTLEEMYLGRLQMEFFPRGPSNIKKLEIKEAIDWLNLKSRPIDELSVEFIENICTYEKLEYLYLDINIFGLYTDEFSENFAKSISKLKNLKEIYIENADVAIELMEYLPSHVKIL